jgi:hypothetical protein
MTSGRDRAAKTFRELLATHVDAAGQQQNQEHDHEYPGPQWHDDLLSPIHRLRTRNTPLATLRNTMASSVVLELGADLGTSTSIPEKRAIRLVPAADGKLQLVAYVPSVLSGPPRHATRRLTASVAPSTRLGLRVRNP